MSLRVIRGRGFDRFDEPCGGVVILTPPRNVDRNLVLRRRTLFTGLAGHEWRGSRVQLTFLPGVAIHMGLQGARSSEAFVAYLALVFFLRARRNLRVELTHHGLGRRRLEGAHQPGWSR